MQAALQLADYLASLRQEASQQRHQCLPLDRTQIARQALLMAGDSLLQPFQQCRPLGCKPEAIDATVVGRRPSCDEAARLQLVQRWDKAGSIQVGSMGQLGLLESWIGLDDHKHAEQPRTDLELAHRVGKVVENGSLRQAQLISDKTR